MSRSYRKSPAIKCADSNKKARTAGNRKYRHHVNRLVRTGEEHLPGIKECSDPWDFPSDGLAIYDKRVFDSYKWKGK